MERTGKNLVVLLVAAWAVLALPSVASAASDTTLQVIAVRVEPGKLEQYVSVLAKLNGVLERLGVPSRLRVWQATVAGDNTGVVVVGIEHADLAAYADTTTKSAADPEWQQLIAGLDEIRTVLSHNLYREITP
jgi:hypothetical protein